MEVDGVDLLAVALLVQHLGQLLQVPQPPGVVPDGGGQEPAARVVAAPRHPRVVTLDVRQRLLSVQTPQLDRAFTGTARHVGGVAAQRPREAAVLHLPQLPILDSAVIVAQKHFQYSVEKKNILGF